MEDTVESVNFITCAVWVPRGAAEANPAKVEISKEDLARIIAETKDNIQELDEVDEEDYEAIENEASGSRTSKRALREDDTIDFDSRYQLKGYDDEEDGDKLKQLLQLGSMAVHASNEEDPYVTLKDDQDEDSEAENHAILPADNLIVVGHVEGEAAIMEVYVYNEGGSLYVHHDILLPAVPLCMEWLNYDPGDKQLKPANLVAIGTMSPVIDVWDLDLVDSLEPAFSLGQKAKKKKKKIPGIGHKKPVLDLAWNKHAEHVLASGSVDETVILWDLQHSTVAQQLRSFEEKVQSLEWHHQESHTLAAGSFEGKVRIFDCRGGETYKTWELEGEVECVAWDTLASAPYNCLSSTDKGKVYMIDARQEKPLWTLDAHTEACTALRMSPKCPGCLVTVSSDKTTKIWDILGETPTLVEHWEAKLGTMTCLASCPDLPFVFCMGGDNKKNNFKVWDIRESEKVRAKFCERVGLPVDSEEMEVEDETPLANPSSSASVIAQPLPATSQGATSNPKPKFKKKKGGHLDRRRKT